MTQSKIDTALNAKSRGQKRRIPTARVIPHPSGLLTLGSGNERLEVDNGREVERMT
jgi:hypothetical protein